MKNDPDNPILKHIPALFYAIIGVAVVLAILIAFLPGPLFLALSNYLQIISAIAGGIILVYLARQARDQPYLLWTGAGFLLWGLSNIGWYLMILLGFRDQVFPSVIDIGLILSIFIIAYGLWKVLPGKKTTPGIFLAILVICLVIPVQILLTYGVNAAGLVTLGYFISCGCLLASGLDFSKGERPLLMLGTFLFALSFMIYPLRELYLSKDPVLPVIGTFICIGFALIVINLMTLTAKKSATA
jgi:hypothetical protein